MAVTEPLGIGTYLAYVVPESQPAASSQSIIYGGYHITLFPEQPFLIDYDLMSQLRAFPMSEQRWHLPTTATVKQRGGLNSLQFNSYTLQRLQDRLESIGWNHKRRWHPLHVTLGETKHREAVAPEVLYETFMAERSWYVQLVRRHTIQRTGRAAYVYEWLPDQRMPLYMAAGSDN